MNIREMIDEWVKKVNRNSPEQLKGNRYVSDFLVEEWTPRVSWFTPPMWKIFRWAYSIRKRLFTNVHPVGINIACEEIKPVDKITIEFNTKPYQSEAIDEVAKEFKRKFSLSNYFIPSDDLKYDMVPVKSKEGFMEICRACWHGPTGPFVYEDGYCCANLKLCMRTYHLGHMDGVYEGGMGKPEYRGSHAYKEREDSK